MSDVLEQPIELEGVPEDTQVVIDTKPQYSEAETKALELGWKPKDQWTDTSKRWRPAEEFLERGELFGKIDSQKKQLYEVEKEVRTLRQEMRRAEAEGYKKAMEELLIKKQEAIELGDIAQYDAVTKQEREYEKKLQSTNTSPPADVPPEAQEFMENNKSWFNATTPENSEMTQYAISMSQYYERIHPNAKPVDILSKVEADVKQRFPHRFQNSNQAKAPVVEGSARMTVAKDEVFDISELNDLERQIYEDSAIYFPGGKQEFLKSLKSLRQ